jgi:hypothetical protein
MQESWSAGKPIDLARLLMSSGIFQDTSCDKTELESELNWSNDEMYYFMRRQY